MGDISEGAPRELGPRRDARQAAVLAKSSDHYGVPRGFNPGCAAPRDHRLARAGPQPCGVGAGRSLVRPHWPVRAGKLPLTGGTVRQHCAVAALRARPGRGHAGAPHRLGGDAHTRACAATGLGTPCLMIVAPQGLRLPDGAGDEPSPWRSGAALLRRDAATEEECVETWEGGREQRGERG